jgi:hypothetical protein
MRRQGPQRAFLSRRLETSIHCEELLGNYCRQPGRPGGLSDAAAMTCVQIIVPSKIEAAHLWKQKQSNRVQRVFRQLDD